MPAGVPPAAEYPGRPTSKMEKFSNLPRFEKRNDNVSRTIETPGQIMPEDLRKDGSNLSHDDSKGV